MTSAFKNYSLPDREPDEIIIRKGDLGGWTMVVRFGAETKTAGFAGGNTLSSVLTAMLVGKEVLAAVAKAEVVLAAAKEPAPAPSKVTKLKTRKKRETAPVAEAPAEPAKKRGRPKLSEAEKAQRAAARKAQANGSENLQQAA